MLQCIYVAIGIGMDTQQDWKVSQNILFCGRSESIPTDCQHFLQLGPVNFLGVNIDHKSSFRFETVLQQMTVPPQNIKFVCYDGIRNGTATDTGSSTTSIQTPFETISDPANLYSLGQSIFPTLTEWESTEYSTVLWFKSLTVLLEELPLEVVFRFILLVTTRVHQLDGIGIYTVNSAITDTETLLTIKSLFDTVYGADIQ